MQKSSGTGVGMGMGTINCSQMFDNARSHQRDVLTPATLGRLALRTMSSLPRIQYRAHTAGLKSLYVEELRKINWLGIVMLCWFMSMCALRRRGVERIPPLTSFSPSLNRLSSLCLGCDRLTLHRPSAPTSPTPIDRSWKNSLLIPSCGN